MTDPAARPDLPPPPAPAGWVPTGTDVPGQAPQAPSTDIPHGSGAPAFVAGSDPGAAYAGYGAPYAAPAPPTVPGYAPAAVPVERVGRGVALSLIVLPVAVALPPIVAELFSFPWLLGVLYAVGISAGLSSLYALGAGVTAHRGRLPLIAVGLVTFILGGASFVLSSIYSGFFAVNKRSGWFSETFGGVVEDQLVGGPAMIAVAIFVVATVAWVISVIRGQRSLVRRR